MKFPSIVAAAYSVLALALFALVPIVSSAQVCGGEQCSASEVCCRSQDGADSRDTFMLCVSETQCNAMNGIAMDPVREPQTERAGQGEDCSQRACQSGLTCVRDVSVSPERSLCEDLSGADTTQIDTWDAPAEPVRPRGGDTTSGGGSSGGGGLVNVLNANSIDQLVVIILDAMVYLGTILLLLMLVWTGFLFIRAQGNTEQINKAKDSLFWTVVGGLVLLGASALSLVLQATIESL